MKRFLIVFLSFFVTYTVFASKIYFVGNESNDLYRTLKNNSMAVQLVPTIDQALSLARAGQGIIVSAEGYPYSRTAMTAEDYAKADKKGVRLFVEYPELIPEVETNGVFVTKLERGVVTSSFFGKKLPEMSILGLNGANVILVEHCREPLISMAKVAGFDYADYGLENTQSYPILFVEGNTMIALTSITNYIKGRFAPHDSWDIVIGKILNWLTGNKRPVSGIDYDPVPYYSMREQLPEDARLNSIIRGTDWLWNANLFIHPTWAREYISSYQTASNPNHFFGPPISDEMLQGNGDFGIMEGHASEISYDGSQKYRYFIRADVQGESAMLLASAASVTDNDKYSSTSENLLDYLFYTSDFRSGERGNKESPVYGFIGWANTHLGAFFNDDNARCVLGAIGASSFLSNQRWNRYIVENILANYRISSRQGFQGGSLLEPDIIDNGIDYYCNRDYVFPSPHFESWMWACYIWLYDKTAYKPLLDKAKVAIRIMMELYPDKWYAQNGTQQQRARMILPLAWLVRVEDTPEHREWLDQMVRSVLVYQEECGAIREELGTSTQDSHNLLIKSNDDYGKNEAALIARNGDPVSDMLYTCNFLFFALNEAAYATGNKEYFNALDKLADFLIRIQVRSNNHKDVDGAWFRAFDYDRWDYWASNADDGWGAWSTLAGWIQSWIVTTEVLIENNTSYWDQTSNMEMQQAFDESKWMLNINNK